MGLTVGVELISTLREGNPEGDDACLGRVAGIMEFHELRRPRSFNHCGGSDVESGMCPDCVAGGEVSVLQWFCRELANKSASTA